MTTYFPYAWNVINFRQEVTYFRSTVVGQFAVSQYLSFQQLATVNKKVLNISQILNFEQVALHRPVTYFRNITQVIPFQQVARNRIFDHNVSQRLEFSQLAYRTHDARNQLFFYQTAIFEKPSGTRQTMQLVQEAKVTVARARSITHTLNFQSHASCIKISPCNDIMVEIDNPPVAVANPVTFVCGARTLTLRAPEFDNSDKFEYTRVNRQTRGGDLVVFRDSQWPKSITFTLHWSALDPPDAAALLLFMSETIGQLVIYTNYEGRVFTGFIKKPENEISQPGKELFAAQIEFETE